MRRGSIGFDEILVPLSAFDRMTINTQCFITTLKPRNLTLTLMIISENENSAGSELDTEQVVNQIC